MGTIFHFKESEESRSSLTGKEVEPNESKKNENVIFNGAKGGLILCCNFTLKLMLALVVFLLVFLVLIYPTFPKTMIKHIYGLLESQYYSGKVGFKTFIYLGMLYVIPGFLIIVSRMLGIKFVKPSTSFFRYWKFPCVKGYYSTVEIFAISTFFFQFAVLCFLMYKKFQVDMGSKAIAFFEASKILGKSAALTSAFIFFPVTKRGFWAEFFSIPFESAIKYHMWISWMLVFLVSLHIIVALSSLYLAGQFQCLLPSYSCNLPSLKHKDPIKYSRIVMYGWMATLVALPMIITSLPRFRRKNYDIFYAAHFLFLPFVVFLHLHDESFIYYLGPGIAAYLLDKVMEWKTTRQHANILSLSCPVPGIVSMVIATELADVCKPGQWVSVKIPQISSLQYHPFTVSKAFPSTEDKPSTIQLNIKVSSGWTKNLESLVSSFDALQQSQTSIFVDGPHGSSHMEMHGYLSHPSIVLVAGGIGITPFFPALKAIINAKNENALTHIKQVQLIWVVHDEEMLDLYKDELSEIQSDVSLLELDVNIQLFVTQPKNFNVASSSVKNRNKEKYVKRKDDIEKCIKRTYDYSKMGDSFTLRFFQQMLGLRIMLCYTMGAGVGYVLGILVSNVISDKWYGEKPFELEVLTMIMSVVIGTISFVLLFGTFDWTIYSCWVVNNSRSDKRSKENTETDPILTKSGVTTYNQGHKNNFILEKSFGYRPDIKPFLVKAKEWIVNKHLLHPSSYGSVGVGVCGPESLTNDVIHWSEKLNSAEVRFVVDSEKFGW